ncbi:type II toxin-antitoxin system RelE/ParE family toxin [Fusobacterium nucleatum]|uniref:type II toxin-antitoxin system RelE family toxin n=1 Tax=Fusobacterium nucleatum TaxID=851 RepID=UPI0030CB6042
MKSYKVTTTDDFDKQFKKLDKQIQIIVLKYIKKLENSENPLIFGSELTGNLKGIYRFRITSYRLLAIIENDKLIIIEAIFIGHRNSVYKRFKIL